MRSLRMWWMDRGRRAQGGRSRPRRGWSVEPLEPRALLAVAGTDYVLSGFTWANPAHITFSIAPDGVSWDHGTNDLNATFDAKFGAGTWEREVARALATWESVANINIVEVPDSANGFDTLGAAQGDPRFGDIRVGGYPFANDTTTLAETYYPPPNGSTAAGDLEVNTAMNFHIGSDYDLYSVLLHETGHALGMAHATNPVEVMYPSYHGIASGLAPGDVAGIQAMYGPRALDAYQLQSQGLGFSTAINATAAVNAAGQGWLSGVSLATIGDVEYFSVVAPANATGALQVAAAAGGISLLSPKVSLYDANGHLLGTGGDPSAWGDNAFAHTYGVVPGQKYYVAVTGATSDAFAAGAYQLDLSFSTSTPRVVTPPPTSPPKTPPAVTVPPTVTAPAPTPNVPADRFEPNDTIAQSTPLGTVTQAIIPYLTLNTAYDVDNFVMMSARAGTYVVAAQGVNVRVIDVSGNVLASGTNAVAVPVARPRTVLYVQITSATGAAVPGYNLGIASIPVTTVVRPGMHREVGMGVRRWGMGVRGR